MTTKQEITDKMSELLEGYTIQNGIIRNPGKFEQEPPETVYFYDCMLNGFGTVMEAEAEEIEYFNLDPAKPFVYVAEDNNGFVSLEFYATEAEAEEADAEDTDGEFYDDDDETDDDETEYPACPMCGTVNGPMGSLGSKTWYRCQSCGMEYSA